MATAFVHTHEQVEASAPFIMLVDAAKLNLVEKGRSFPLLLKDITECLHKQWARA